MPQDKNTGLSETAIVEKTAQELVNDDMQNSNQPQEPSTPPTRETRRTRREQARRARNQPYGDANTPRIVSHRRYGGSSHSRAFLREDLFLYSDRAQIFFERNYERVNLSLIVCTLVTEAMGGVDLAEKVSAVIEKRFRELETEMITALKELKRGATEKGIPENRQVPAYDNKRSYSPPLHTPHSAQFMTVVTLFDRIIARVEGCWINRLMSPQTRRTMISSWEGKLVRFVREIDSIRKAAIDQARSSGFGQRAETIERNARRQQAEEKLEKTDVATSGANDKPDQISTSKEEVEDKVPASKVEEAVAQTSQAEVNEAPASETDVVAPPAETVKTEETTEVAESASEAEPVVEEQKEAQAPVKKTATRRKTTRTTKA